MRVSRHDRILSAPVRFLTRVISPSGLSIAAGLSAWLTAGCLFETTVPSENYPTDVTGLPAAVPSPTLALRNGDTLHLKVEYVRNEIAGRPMRMLGFNRSIPGPTLQVKEGSQIIVVLINGSNVPITLHSHGVRLDSHDDGTDGLDQKPVAQGDSFVYTIRFPDAGVFWYHSHYREDYSQEMGLYGNYLVSPSDSTYWDPVNREVTWMLDDIDTINGGIAPFSEKKVDHTLMGRFGNTFLINGTTDYALTLKRGEVVRFYVTNASDARVFNLEIDRSGLKIVGSDNGRYEVPLFSPNEYIAPGERSVFEVLFNDTGSFDILYAIPGQTFTLGRIHVLADAAEKDYSRGFFSATDTCAQVVASIDPFRPYFDKPPDKELILTGTMGSMSGMAMKVVAPAHDPTSVNQMGIEWTDHMAAMNAASDTGNMHWIIRDKQTGLENMDIFWTFKTGDKVMIRMYNDSLAYHPMPHPIHFHGQRFLVVNVDGKRNPDMAWKDTFLIGRGSTADILLDASNPGGWMAHCHIAEHMEDGMMFFFHVGD